MPNKFFYLAKPLKAVEPAKSYKGGDKQLEQVYKKIHELEKQVGAVGGSHNQPKPKPKP